VVVTEITERGNKEVEGTEDEKIIEREALMSKLMEKAKAKVEKEEMPNVDSMSNVNSMPSVEYMARF
jgi:hypothetical protein